jgi:hypothetical protein
MKISSCCSFKNSQKQKTPGGKKIYIISSYSKAKNMPKIAEVKLSSCGLDVVGFRKNSDCGIAELRLRSNISLKSCGIVIVEVLPSSCGIAIADSKKSCACPPLINHHALVFVAFIYLAGNIWPWLMQLVKCFI